MHQHFSPVVQNEASLASLSAKGEHGSSGGRVPPIRPAISFGTLNFSNSRNAAAAEMWSTREALQKHHSLEFSSRSSGQLLVDLEPQRAGKKGAHGKAPLTRTTSTPFVLEQQGKTWACDGGDVEPVSSSQSPNASYSSFQEKQQDRFSPDELNHSSRVAEAPPGHRNCGQCPYHFFCSAEDPYFSSLSPEDPPSPVLAVGQDTQGPPCMVASSPPPRPASPHIHHPSAGRTSLLSECCWSCWFLRVSGAGGGGERGPLASSRALAALQPPAGDQMGRALRSFIPPYIFPIKTDDAFRTAGFWGSRYTAVSPWYSSHGEARTDANQFLEQGNLSRKLPEVVFFEDPRPKTTPF